MAKSLTDDPMAPSYWNEACRYLMTVSDQWAVLVKTYPSRALRTRGKPFETLVRSVVGQQISVKAADAVWLKLVNALGGQFDADALNQADEALLRSVGLSRQKIKYIGLLCEFNQQGGLELERLEKMSDNEVTAHLTQVKGVGRWTAQMFMIFALRRPDVWPIDDIGLHKAISQQFKNGENIGRNEAINFGESIKPWRTVACWYLWRSLDPIVVDY